MQELRGACGMCGKCCEAIHIPLDINEIRKGAENGWGDATFVRDNWTPITLEQAYEINPFLKKTKEDQLEKGNANPHEGMHFYTCDRLDRSTKLCTVHENRPQVCSEYPWYGRKPSSDFIFYTKDCGYRVDAEDAAKEALNHETLPETIVKEMP
ncbi:Flagellin N-methylase [compost metagenome]